MTETLAVNKADANAKAKTAIADLLQKLGIGQVFCVDDVYARKWTIDDVQAAQLQLSPEQLMSVFPEIGNVPDDRDVRREKCRLAWLQLDGVVQEERARQILSFGRGKTDGAADDTGAASALQELIGKERLIQLTPADWAKKEGEVLAAAADGPILVLFDQDLSQAGGSATGGMALVKNVLAKDTSGKLLCGLLTHTATIDNQHVRWEECANEAGVERDRFVLVPKGWLSQDPLGFARNLKGVALAPDCERLKERIRAILNSTTVEAAREIDGLSVFDFDYVVFRASHTEGMWEPDMLFRLHALFQRTALREKAYSDDQLRGIVGRVRQVSLIPTDSEGSPVPISCWRLQQREMYESGEHINRLHLPIEIGDIFQKTEGTSTKTFILLGQPCDLMVRSKGKRTPEMSDALLAEIAAGDEEKPYTEPVPYYSDDGQAKHFVRFRRVHFIHPCVLDLCAFNHDGMARMDLSTACPDDLMPSWAERFGVLRGWAEAILSRYETFGENKANDKVVEEAFRREAVKLFPPIIGNSNLFKATIELGPDARRITFNCKRVKRLCRARALALTLQYAACFSRPGFDRDLGLPAAEN